jgi:phage terminase large subunit-like protein
VSFVLYRLASKAQVFILKIIILGIYKESFSENMDEPIKIETRGRKRKTREVIRQIGLPGYTKKQAGQHLRGEKIDRTPRGFKKFDWPKKRDKDAFLKKTGRELIGADLVKEFFGKFITHTEDRRWKGKKWQWIDWQIDFIDKLFGTLKSDGLRQYKKAYLEIGKKNGKTELAAGLCLFCLLADGEGSPEVILAAKDRGQAKKCFEAAEKMVRQNRNLPKYLKVLVSQKKISYVVEGGFLEVVSKDSGSQHGRNISTLVFDELHTQQGRDLYDILTQGSGAARQQYLHIFLTTSGWDRTSICYEVHQKALKVKANPEIDPTFLPIIYSVPEELNWEDEENWKLANPSLGTILDMEKMREDFRDAKETPAAENVFKRLRLCQWTSQETKWVSLSEWDKCGVPLLIETLSKRPAYGGLDLSSSIDLTAFVLIFSPLNGDGTIDIIPHFWLPEEGMEKRIQRDHLPYDVWIKRGLIESIPGKVIDYGYVKAKILELRETYNFSEISFDPQFAAQLALDLEKEGLVMVKFNQTGYQYYNPPMNEFLTKIINGKIRHGGNPVLRAQLDALRVSTNHVEQIRPEKLKSNSRIDGITAAIMAYDRLMRHPELEKFVYQPGSISSLGQDEVKTETIKEEIKPMSLKSGIECERCHHDTESLVSCQTCGKQIGIEVRIAA